MEKKKMLIDHFSFEYAADDDDTIIIIDNKRYEYEMTLSPNVPDDECCRVMINNEYYYFG